MATRPSRSVENGARPLRSLQCGAAQGSEPQLSPHPQRLEVLINRLAAPGGGGERLDAQTSGTTNLSPLRTGMRRTTPNSNKLKPSKSVIIKMAELEHILHEENITICCIQETSSVYQILQREMLSVLQVRQNRPKQRTNIDSCQKQHQRLSDRHSHGRLSINDIKADTADIQLVNFHCPNDNLYLSIPSAHKSPTLQ